MVWYEGIVSLAIFVVSFLARLYECTGRAFALPSAAALAAVSAFAK